MSEPKFRQDQLVKIVADWSDLNGQIGIVSKIGNRYIKNKKGESVLETFSYIIRLGFGFASDPIVYFLEDELK